MILPALICGPALAFAVGLGTTFGTSDTDPYNPNDSLACYRPKRLTADTEGIATWAVPCRARVLVCVVRTWRCAWTRVVDRGPRRALVDLSTALADRLGHRGRERVVIAWAP